MRLKSQVNFDKQRNAAIICVFMHRRKIRGVSYSDYTECQQEGIGLLVDRSYFILPSTTLPA